MNTEREGEREFTGVGHGDFADLIGVEPDLASPALEDARGEPLLELQRHHRLLFTSLSPLTVGAGGQEFWQ